MRQTILGLAAVAGLAIAGTAPASACGFDPCGQSYAPAYSYSYQAPAPTYSYPAPAPAYSYESPAYSGCGACGGSYERLVEPTTQYYYVNQGPTYSGPGAFAPYPTYREAAVPVYPSAYRRPYSYGYGARHYGTPYYAGAGVAGPAVYGYHRVHRSYYARPSYGEGYGYHHPHHVARYGYAPYYRGHRVLRRYD